MRTVIAPGSNEDETLHRRAGVCTVPPGKPNQRARGTARWQGEDTNQGGSSGVARRSRFGWVGTGRT